MVPTAPDPGDAADHEVQRLSPEAAWGVRALIMVLMFLLRWVGRDQSVPTIDALDADEAAPTTVDDSDRSERAERVAKGTVGSTTRIGAEPSSPPSPATGRDELAAANRRRAMYASALTAAGTVAWMAGRRSGRRG